MTERVRGSKVRYGIVLCPLVLFFAEAKREMSECVWLLCGLWGGVMRETERERQLEREREREKVRERK